jgi:hypothetical protein
MDPVTIVTLVMILIRSCVKLSFKLCSNVEASNAADVEIRLLEKEVKSCLDSLEMLDNYLKSPSNRNDNRLRALEDQLGDCRQTLGSVKLELETLQRLGNRSPINFLGLDFKPQRAARITEKVKRCHQILTSVSNSISMYTLNVLHIIDEQV